MMNDVKKLYDEIILPDGNHARLIHEVSMSFFIDGKTAGVVSCTPCDLEEFAVGWMISEGIADSVYNIGSIRIKEEGWGCHITIRESQEAEKASDEGSEGIRPDLSREAMSDLYSGFATDPPLRAATDAAHSCMVVYFSDDRKWESMYRSEDAGRHSALDKAIGWMALNGIDPGRCVLMTSGRISTHMAKKAAAVGAAALTGKGTVTAEAREIAGESGMVLIGWMNAHGGCRFVDSPVESDE